MLDDQLLTRALRCANCLWRPVQLGLTSLPARCPGCALVACCSPACWREYAPRHTADACLRFSSILQTDEMWFRAVVTDGHREVPIIINEDREKEPMRLPANWTAFYTARPAGIDMMTSRLRSATTEAMSRPLVALRALEALLGPVELGKRVELSIHVVGASNTYDAMRDVNAWEELAHVLPALRTLHLLMVGPDVMIDVPPPAFEQTMQCETCPNCATVGLVRTLTFAPYLTYEGYVEAKGDAFTPPDLAIAFNCGFHDEPESWEPALVFILASCIPLCFTSYTRAEAERDYLVVALTTAAIDGAPIRVVVPPEEFAFAPEEGVVGVAPSVCVDGTLARFRPTRGWPWWWAEGGPAPRVVGLEGARGWRTGRVCVIFIVKYCNL